MMPCVWVRQQQRPWLHSPVLEVQPPLPPSRCTSVLDCVLHPDNMTTKLAAAGAFKDCDHG
jgi:hypothetical protein